MQNVHLFITAIVITFTGCQSHSEKIYQAQLVELESARNGGEISASEFLKLKLQMQNAHEQREATILASPDPVPYQAPY
jgi:hypothetical protein